MAKLKRLRNECLNLAQALGNRPSLAELRKLQGLTAELVDGGYWPACQSLAALCGKSIWVLMDYGQLDARSLPHEAKAEVLHQATWGILTVDAFLEAGGRKIDQAVRDLMQQYRQEFVEYATITGVEQFRQIPSKVRRCGVCGNTTASDEYILSDTGLFVCAKCHGYGYGNDPDIMDCPSCGYRFDPGDNRMYFEEYRCAHCGAALEKVETRLF
jgi:hypothetical protein